MELKICENCVQIVGGMTWCVELCCVDLDLDLMYNESLSIGQKMWVIDKHFLISVSLMCLLCYFPVLSMLNGIVKLFPIDDY